MNIKKLLGLDEIAKPIVKDLSDYEIEAERIRFWKCPKCKELTEMEGKMCWKCYADRPQNIEHPSKEEILKTLKKSASSIPFYTGLFLLVFAVLIYIRGSLHRGIETFDLVFIGLFLVPALLLIIYSAYRKIRGS
jgi:hypothetical protein